MGRRIVTRSGIEIVFFWNVLYSVPGCRRGSFCDSSHFGDALLESEDAIQRMDFRTAFGIDGLNIFVIMGSNPLVG